MSSQIKHASTIGIKLVKQQYLLRMSSQYGELLPIATGIGSLVWAPQQISTCFRILASLLQRRRSTEAKQSLHGVWPSPGLVHYIYIFGGSCRVTEFCQVQYSLCILPSLALSCVTARHFSSGREPNFAALSTGRHLYSAGRPSRWALAHILVEILLFV